MRIYQADITRDLAVIRGLATEYLAWVEKCLADMTGYHFNVVEKVAQDLTKLGMFLPPAGRLLLAEVDDFAAGVGCLHQIRLDTGEIKRMYVRPEFRGQGVGRALLNELTNQAIELGYTCLCLDSATFLTAAHTLYRSFGFYPIAPYPETEIPPELQRYWLYMEKRLES